MSETMIDRWNEAKDFLTAYEAELCRDKSIPAEQAPFTNTKKSNY